MNEKGKMTFRFNDQKQDRLTRQHIEESPVKPDNESYELEPIQREEVEQNPPVLNTFTTDFGAWESEFTPSQRESDHLEQLIRATDQNNNKQQIIPLVNNDEKRQFYGPLIDLQPTRLRSRRTKRPMLPMKKMVVSFCAAIMIGLMIGHFVLNLFSDTDQAQQVQTGPGNTENTHVTDEQDYVAGNDDISNEVMISLPVRTISVLQNGVFSTEDGALTAQTELHKQGFAAAIFEGDTNHFVYAAFASDHTTAEALKEQLVKEEIEVFIKTIQIPAVAQISWDVSTSEQLQTYFLQAHKLIDMINQVAIIHLQEDHPTPLGQSSMQSIQAEHQKLTQLVGEVSDDMSETHRNTFEQMNKALNTAIHSLDAYTENPSKTYLWKTQNELLSYVTAEKKWLEQA